MGNPPVPRIVVLDAPLFGKIAQKTAVKHATRGEETRDKERGGGGEGGTVAAAIKPDIGQ